MRHHLLALTFTSISTYLWLNHACLFSGTNSALGPCSLVSRCYATCVPKPGAGFHVAPPTRWPKGLKLKKTQPGAHRAHIFHEQGNPLFISRGRTRPMGSSHQFFRNPNTFFFVGPLRAQFIIE